jgi:hypothetical protein
LQFHERQAPEHYKPPTFWNAIKYYVIYIVALSDRSWMKTLAAYILSLSRKYAMNPM